MFPLRNGAMEMTPEIVPVADLRRQGAVIPAKARPPAMEFGNLAALQNPVAFDDDNVVPDTVPEFLERNRRGIFPEGRIPVPAGPRPAVN